MTRDEQKQGRKALLRLLEDTKFAVLATQGPEGPYTSLVGIAPADALERIAFATRRDTTKYRNLERNDSASLLLDDRAARGEDVRRLTAVTLVGHVAESTGEERARLQRVLEERLPRLSEFISSEECAVMAMRTEWCRVVSGFQSGIDLQVDI